MAGTLISKTHEAYSYYAPRHEIRLVAPGELPSPPGEEETGLSISGGAIRMPEISRHRPIEAVANRNTIVWL